VLLRLTWVGGPTARIEIGSFRILTDPMLGEGPEAFVMRRHPSTGEYNVPIARLAPLPAVDLDDLDLVIASHLHGDHFDPRAVERLDKGLQVLAPTPNVRQLRDWGFHDVTGLDWRQGLTWHKDGQLLRVLAVPAHHAHDEVANHELGTVNGYLIEHVAGDSVVRVYWTGDTVWFDELGEVAETLPGVDLLLPHLGGVGSDGGPWGADLARRCRGHPGRRGDQPRHSDPDPPQHVPVLRRTGRRVRPPARRERLPRRARHPRRRRELDRR